MCWLDLAAFRQVEQGILVSCVASTAGVMVSSAFNCRCLQRIHGLGHSSTAHRVDVGRCVGFANDRMEMARVPSSIVRSDSGVDRRSVGFFASGLLVEFYGGIDFVCRFAIVSIFTYAYQRTIFNECVHGTHKLAVLSSSLLGRIFCQHPCRAMGNVRGDAFVHAGTSDSYRLEPSLMGYHWFGDLSWLDGQSFLGAMVCACSAFVDGLTQYCRDVCICNACGLVVATIRRFVHLASAQLANA